MLLLSILRGSSSRRLVSRRSGSQRSGCPAKILRRKSRADVRRGESGYILLLLIMLMALAALAATAVVQTVEFEIKRDREEELIHRGVQYSRAIRAYYKRFGRYPPSMDALDNTNNLRYLRKHYKDPINGGDFKILHFGEVKLFGFTTGIPGATPAAALANGANPQNGLNPGPGGLGNPGLNPAAGQGFNQQGFNQAAGTGATGTDPSQDPSGNGGNNGAPGTSGTGTSGSGDTGGSNTGSNDSNGGNGTNGQPSGPTFGGMPMVGVASTSKKDSFREFNHKHKYNEWQFVYDPGTDRGGLLMTPNQPPIQQAGQAGQNQQNGQNPTNGLQPTSGPQPSQGLGGQTPPATTNPNQQ